MNDVAVLLLQVLLAVMAFGVAGLAFLLVVSALDRR